MKVAIPINVQCLIPHLELPPGLAYGPTVRLPPEILQHPRVQGMLTALGREAIKYADPRAECDRHHDAVLVTARLVIAPEESALERRAERIVAEAEDRAHVIIRLAEQRASYEFKYAREVVAYDLRQLWESFNGYDECAGRR